jgi:zinc protease
MYSKVKCFALFCSLLLLFSNPILAQENKLPEGKQVLADYIKAIGGEEKVAQLKSMQQDFQIDLPAIGISGSGTQLMGGSGKFRQEMELAGIGNQTSGSDGTTAWEMSAITGARIVEDDEAETYHLMNSGPVPQFTYGKYFDKIECTGIEKFDGVECYLVKYTKGDKKPMFDYFDKSTGLLRGGRQTMTSPQGEIEVESTLSEYKEVDGVKFAFNTSMQLGPGQTMEMKTKELKLNPKFEANRFELPDEVKLLKK